MVFLHGWGGGISSFFGVAKALSDEFRVVLVDMYGFGDSPEPKIPLTLEDYADGIRGTMSELGVSSAAFVCHSFGGRVGLRLAVSHPELVERLALVDSAGLKPRRKPVYYIRRAVHFVLKRFGRGLPGSADYRALSPVMKQTFKNVVNEFQEKDCERVGCDAAVFWGKRDKDTPPYMARRFLRRIKGAELFYLDGGHFAYLEDPTFAPILRAFLRG